MWNRQKARELTFDQAVEIVSSPGMDDSGAAVARLNWFAYQAIATLQERSQRDDRSAENARLHLKNLHKQTAPKEGK